MMLDKNMLLKNTGRSFKLFLFFSSKLVFNAKGFNLMQKVFFCFKTKEKSEHIFIHKNLAILS